MNALTALKTELDRRNGLLVDIAKNQLELCRDWSYQITVNTAADWFVPGDELVEVLSHSLYVTFNGTAFIAKDEADITVALEVVEDGDIEAAAYSMAETLDDLIPERNIAEEIEEARADSIIFSMEAA